jgi:hypothetical protein
MIEYSDRPAGKQSMPFYDFDSNAPRRPIKSTSGRRPDQPNQSEYATSLGKWAASYEDVPEFQADAHFACVAASFLSCEAMGASCEKVEPVMRDALKSLYC